MPPCLALRGAGVAAEPRILDAPRESRIQFPHYGTTSDHLSSAVREQYSPPGEPHPGALGRRFCPLLPATGYETLYVCGTHEYGTATETTRAGRGDHPRELCDRYTPSIGTSTPGSTSLSTSSAAPRCRCIRRSPSTSSPSSTRTATSPSASDQPFCEKDQRFLADRYVLGTCPHCGYADARGDQCENCGKLLDPTELIDPRLQRLFHRPVIRETKHLFIDLPASCQARRGSKPPRRQASGRAMPSR